MPTIWELFAGFGLVINDVLAILSAIGSFMVLLFGRNSGQRFPYWAASGLVFGAFFQVCLYATKMMPAKLGVFRLDPTLVSGLLVISALFLVLRLAIRGRN
jgi:hypothetical protein